MLEVMDWGSYDAKGTFINIGAVVLNRQNGQWPNAATDPVIPGSVLQRHQVRELQGASISNITNGWTEKEVVDGALGAQEGAQQQQEDQEKKKKREEKAREKELKKLKAAQKAEAVKAPAPPSKKSEQKAKKAAAAASNEADAVDPFTPPREKKLLAPEMAKSYNPKAVEASWYEWWEKSGFFVVDPESKKPPFVIVVPPPNVTGTLHIGHALTGAIEDMLVRWRRMSGYNTLWVPGVDHAGIATQVVVEKKIMKEGNKTRHDLGREQFVAEVYKWKEQSGGTICNQFRRTGMSLDWSRECFTMDAKLSKADLKAMVNAAETDLLSLSTLDSSMIEYVGCAWLRWSYAGELYYSLYLYCCCTMGRDKRMEFAESFYTCYNFRLLYISGTLYPILGALRYPVSASPALTTILRVIKYTREEMRQYK
ncbi:unnamed protein product [Sphagnum troendelagicum]